MSVNAVESTNAQPVAQTHNSELIYRLEDRPVSPDLVCRLSASAGHVRRGNYSRSVNLRALGLPAQDTQHIISMSLFASGVAIIQIKHGAR